MSEYSCPLGKLLPGDFLNDYWQKKPLVIRQAFAGFHSPVTAEELAGLACEEGVESRLVIEKDGQYPWQVIHGPMDEGIFAELPESHWTLLVNDVEKYLPALASVMDQFRFVPEWRVDDLMISFAPYGGSVGPHMDQYDVFILQAQGHRRWQVHQQPVTDDNLVEGADLRVQKDFDAEQEWLLGPGDMIYIPPGVSHFGVATDDCISFSIGFRAPAHSEMLGSFTDFISKDLTADMTFKDGSLVTQLHANEITAEALDNVRRILSGYLTADHPALMRWFGCFVSDTKADIEIDTPPSCGSLDDLLIRHSRLLRHPASRFAFMRQDQAAVLFIDGQDYDVSLGFAMALCDSREVDISAMAPWLAVREAELIMELYNAGILFTDFDD